jgi:hypothetical protein
VAASTAAPPAAAPLAVSTAPLRTAGHPSSKIINPLAISDEVVPTIDISNYRIPRRTPSNPPPRAANSQQHHTSPPPPTPPRPTKSIKKSSARTLEARKLREEQRAARAQKAKRLRRYCKVCKLSCNSTIVYADHLQSRGHKYRTALPEEDPFCGPCNRHFPDKHQLTAHLRGNSHLRVITKNK